MGTDRLKLESCLLYAVTDTAWLRGQTLAEQVEAALRGGVTMVQLREKELTGEALEQEACEIQALCRRYNVPFLINDDVLLAKKIGADGVHVGQSDMAAEQARALLGQDAIIGVTARTVEQAKAAEAAGADYIGSGAVFGTSTKKDAKPLDPAYFQEICESVSIPVVAIGGITLDNIRQLSGRKMCGFAIVSGIFAAEDIEAQTKKLWRAAQALVLPAAESRLRAKVREKHPVVQCITNIVTVNDCANALLAVGASPTMAHHPQEMEDFAVIRDALVCNMGATESLEAMFAAGKVSMGFGGDRADSAFEAGKVSMGFGGDRADSALEPGKASAIIDRYQPVSSMGADASGIDALDADGEWTDGGPIVIDPVGCASSAFRRARCLDLIREVYPACIRGNAAEIRALATGHNTARGVDDLMEAEAGKDRTGAAISSGTDVDSEAEKTPAPEIIETVRDAMHLARQTGAIVVASGETDYVTDGLRVYEVHGGTPWMTRVTGTGCMLSSILGAFLAVENSALSAAACCAMMNACAETALAWTAQENGGTGTYHIRLMDALSGPVR